MTESSRSKTLEVMADAATSVLKSAVPDWNDPQVAADVAHALSKE